MGGLEKPGMVLPKAELFRRSDVLTIHLGLSDRIQGLVSAPDLAMMKPTSWLVNTSRVNYGKDFRSDWTTTRTIG
jgi:phosphoglycerate dehydrogenase-like enzyme